MKTDSDRMPKGNWIKKHQAQKGKETKNKVLKVALTINQY
jgi:hypothetical protein